MAKDPERILVAVGGEATDEGASRLACRLAKEARGKLYAIYVVEVPREFPVDAEISHESARGEAALQRIEELAKEED